MKAQAILFAVLVAVLAGLNVYQYFGPKPTPLSIDGESRAARGERFNRMIGGEVMKNRWFGVLTFQQPLDVWITQEIIFEVKPDVIVETGTMRGGSAALWAAILEQANSEGRVITIDINDVRDSAAKQLPITQRRVDFLQGSSTDPKVVSEVARRVKGKRVLVILDSLHVKKHVLDELRAYSPLVSIGSYLIVQDTNFGRTVPFFQLPQKWQPGPLDAVEDFLASTDEFVADSSRERFFATNNLGGFLKRIK